MKKTIWTMKVIDKNSLKKAMSLEQEDLTRHLRRILLADPFEPTDQSTGNSIVSCQCDL